MTRVLAPSHHRYRRMPASQKQVVLLGMGHTNAHVVDRWRKSPLPGARLVCISNFPVATYSGMLPGSLAGQYAPQKMEINLKSIAQAARAELVLGQAEGVDLKTQRVNVENHAAVRFDVLSVGVGSTPNLAGVDVSAEGLLSIKPMQTFLTRLYDGLQKVRQRGLVRILVVGGGVGGIEMALCLPVHLRSVLGRVPHRLSIVEARDRIGQGLSPGAAQKVETLLQQRGVELMTRKRVAQVHDGEVVLDDGGRVEAELVVWATGAAPPEVLERIALPKDPTGFLLTHNTLQSTGSENIFAVGDTGTVAGMDTPKAGVYAVREGPVLWRNIGALVRDRPLTQYEPQSDFLRLVNTGDGKALMDYKGLAVHARWCWFLKDWIDGRFMSRFIVTRQ